MAHLRGVLSSLWRWGGFAAIGKDSISHSHALLIFVAMNLVVPEVKGFDAFLECVSPYSGLWQVRIHVNVCEIRTISFRILIRKLRALSERVVVNIVEDQADLFVGFKEASDHSGIVKDLGSPFD